jgi:hypothetical protein
MNKVIKDGKVAVLYSPCYGAGWSTWNSDDKDFLLFDPKIVAAVENKNYDLAAKLATEMGKEMNGSDDYTCTLGAEDLEIEWIPEGEEFEVTEYDGNEGINIISQKRYKRA